MDNSLVVVALIRAKPGKSGELRARLNALLTESRREEGVLTYDLHQSATDPDQWLVYERYLSPAAFRSHMESLPLQQFLAYAPAIVEGEIDIRTFKMVSDPILRV